FQALLDITRIHRLLFAPIADGVPKVGRQPNRPWPLIQDSPLCNSNPWPRCTAATRPEVTARNGGINRPVSPQFPAAGAGSQTGLKTSHNLVFPPPQTPLNRRRASIATTRRKAPALTRD